MNTEKVRTEIEAILNCDGDAENTHYMEDALNEAFIEHVASLDIATITPEEIIEILTMAKDLKILIDMVLTKWYA